jgi:hypothetical protein
MMLDLLISSPDVLANVIGAVVWFICSVALRYTPEPRKKGLLAVFNGAQRVFANFDRVRKAKERIAADQAAESEDR